jgi:nucleotide-binding universal stress UspA family protein
MQKRILVPLDGSADAEAALSVVTKVCDKTDEIILLTVANPDAPVELHQTRPGSVVIAPSGILSSTAHDMPVYAETPAQALEHTQARISDYLDSKADPLRRSGFHVLTAVEFSEDAAKAIVAFARNCEPTFLIMTRTRHPNVSDRIFGTVAQHVVRADVAPVMIAPI